jgi:hypothetical protein
MRRTRWIGRSKEHGSVKLWCKCIAPLRGLSLSSGEEFELSAEAFGPRWACGEANHKRKRWETVVADSVIVTRQEIAL